MTRCTPCMLCGTHRKLATVYRIAVRLPRSTRRCCAIPFLGSPCVNVSPAPSFVHVVEKQPELAGARRLAQLAQSLGFDLANALAGDGELPTNLLQRVLRIVLQTKTHLHDLLLARSQSVQHLPGLLLQVHVDGSLVRRERSAVFDEVAEMRIPLLPNWRLQRDRYLHDLSHFSQLGHGNVHAFGDRKSTRL